MAASDKSIIKKHSKLAEEIIALESEYAKLSDTELRSKTDEFKKRIQENGESLDSILVEAFAVAREAAYRKLGMKAYKVQLIGGIILHNGDIAEMRTGEGKTLTGIFPVYLNALTGKPVHIVTVNEYLSGRDSKINGVVFNFLGLTVGLNGRALSKPLKRQAYSQDITYTTNAELGFDYLRDNLVIDFAQKVQRGLNYVVIDEADSVLIDEARTPLIISGGTQNRNNQYQAADSFAKKLNKHVDLKFDLETKQINMTDSGIAKAEKFFGLVKLFDIKNSELFHLITNALRANFTFSEGVEYMVSDGEIKLIDQFTGRVMDGRSYSDGLQQALQAKEGVKIEEETQTLATITYQNFYRLYSKISGMTGTAKTEEEEFIKIYNTRVIQCPTNKPVIRKDLPDFTFGTKRAALLKMTKDIKEIIANGRPILIGTTSVESSEQISRYLTNESLKFEMINAKNHHREADIVEMAGQVGSITLATNMAGRGTDIKLSDDVKKNGGLFVIGVERNEARRIDNQLRGRAGRQGDPGSSRFYITMEDDLMIRFSSPRVRNMFAKLGDDHINSKMFTKALTNAQKKLEGLNFDQRKNILDYDNILSQQRESIYSQRDTILLQEDLTKVLERFQYTTAYEIVNDSSEVVRGERIINLDRLKNDIVKDFIDPNSWNKNDYLGLDKAGIAKKIQVLMMQYYLYKSRNIPQDVRTKIERTTIVKNLDSYWTKHINISSKLRSGIYLQQYAQNNPLHEYIEESSRMFNNMKINIASVSVKHLITSINDDMMPNLNIQQSGQDHVHETKPEVRITEADVKQILSEIGIEKEQFTRPNVEKRFQEILSSELTEEQKRNILIKQNILSQFMQKLDKMIFEQKKQVQITDEMIVAVATKYNFKKVRGNNDLIMEMFNKLSHGQPDNVRKQLLQEAILIRDLDKIIKENPQLEKLINDIDDNDDSTQIDILTKIG
ncbi:preprotein translocase subunit SecA [Spiroplasma sp. TIUS-1]|uniref:preprotein translocase subunit SecA n=1 Tax=Spiroplasma sp. TIUS-1 TaxID=216963 RepID=UPI001397ED01|nr:preprotein translocase subunit SecA [Spiroplasma sp. TIUS-1]QHX36192.1 preprotein translocase subunit SecA [Spiroplasma sp. TIUS-1]